jgi:hypothetical protein
MPFEEGREKTGGKTKGSLNKKTAEMKAKLQELFDKGVEFFLVDIANLEAKDRLDFLIKLLPYLAPKIAPEANGADSSIKLYINHTIGDLDDGD